jgi:hypothetical protein
MEIFIDGLGDDEWFFSRCKTPKDCRSRARRARDNLGNVKYCHALLEHLLLQRFWVNPQRMTYKYWDNNHQQKSDIG